MPGLDWDLNLESDLQATSRRLSLSDSPSSSASPPRRGRPTRRGENPTKRYERSPPREPRLPRIEEDSEEQAAETLVHFSRYTAPPSSRGASGALCPAPGEMPPPTAIAPVATSLVLAPPAPMQFQQPQEAVAAARREEAWAFLREEYQRQLQAALQLQQQQAWTWAAAARSQSQQLRMYTVDGGPAGYETKWEELHPVSQGLLLQIEDRIRQYRDECERLGQCSCLDDLSLCNKSLELNASQISQEAGSISTIMDREKVSIESLTAVVKEIMWSTDFAIRSYVKLGPRFVHRSAGSANAGYAIHSGSCGAHTDFSQLLTMAPTFHCYGGAPRRPSPFVQYTVARFEDHLGECCKWILELEQLVQMKNDKTFAESLESLLKVMSNVHDYLIHVAAKVEDIHQYVETMKAQYLIDQLRRGANDPFLEADRREAAIQEATARIVHPMLHLSPPGQRTTPVAAPMMASQLQQTALPTVEQQLQASTGYLLL
ncbi:nuclear pore complex protein NUP58-like isoform X2 [Phragmites australis]|uniref:nuclear pore complex protein NUP58-like isoform X2 n=1 Tax=Phragmites australis TaxID=29695 RepID=UPI002D78D406|nr:nuclear pore complex protein NUP58-like isoform X2 [Phragmites australis]